MNIYEIPRNYKGESRILSIFSTKALVYTAVGVGIGLIPYAILNILGLGTIGLILIVALGGIGFGIGTCKVPESKKFSITQKTGKEAIDNVIKKWVKFKTRKNKIYVYTKEETKDE